LIPKKSWLYIEPNICKIGEVVDKFG
jgi:hypothetical protein